MKKRFYCLRIGFIFLFFPATIIVNAQEPADYKKNAVTFNLTRCMVSEINMGYERFLSYRRSIEIDGGMVYSNTFWADQAKDWTNAVLFYEHGYTGRFHYKIFKRKETVSRWREYIAPGLAYKNVYFNDHPVTSEEKLDYFNYRYTETFLRDRTRQILSAEFLWGNIYEATRTFAFEIYYGAGLSATMAKRTDHNRYATYVNPANQYRNQSVPDYEDKSFYMRPYILLGVKLRLSM